MPERFQALVACALCLGPMSVPAGGQETLQRAFSDLEESVRSARVGEASAKAVASPRPAWSAARDDGWELVQQDPELAIYLRAKAGTSIREVKAVGTVEAPPSVAWKVIGDYDNYASFMPYVKECRVVKKAGDRVFYVYQLLATASKVGWIWGQRAYRATVGARDWAAD